MPPQPLNHAAKVTSTGLDGAGSTWYIKPAAVCRACWGRAAVVDLYGAASRALAAACRGGSSRARRPRARCLGCWRGVGGVLEGAIWATSAGPDDRIAAFPWALSGSTVARPECAALESPPQEARPASRCTKNGGFDMALMQPKQNLWPHTGSCVHCRIAQKQTWGGG